MTLRIEVSLKVTDPEGTPLVQATKTRQLPQMQPDDDDGTFQRLGTEIENCGVALTHDTAEVLNEASDQIRDLVRQARAYVRP